MKSYLWFKEMKPNKKTKRWLVVSESSNEALGRIQWYSPWRQYCFDADESSIFSAGCLREITDFMALHKNDRVSSPSALERKVEE